METMPLKKHLLPNFWLALIVLAITLLNSYPGWAQEAGQDTGKDKPASQDTSKKTGASGEEPASPVEFAWADSYIHQLGSAGLLAGNRQGIGWGSLYIPSASATGLLDKVEGSSTAPGSSYESAIFQAAVVYDHKIGGSRLAIQYSPSVAIENGQVVGNFSSQNASLDLLLYSRRRWSVRFNDTFSYYYAQQSFGQPYFDVNPSNSHTVTNNFIDGPNRWLSDTANLSVSYALSRRASISVAPNFTFSEGGTGVDLNRAASYGGSVTWNYRTGERQTVGLLYYGQLIHEGFPIATIPPTTGTSDTIYNTIAGTIARQLSATWNVRGALGATTGTTAQTPPIPRQWSFYGSFGVVKQMKRSSIGLNYSRGDTLSSGLISSQYADRVDISYQYEVVRRLYWTAGGGYLRQVQASGFSGWYVSSDVQFLLAPRNGIFAFFSYSRKNQAQNTRGLFAGDVDFFSFGLRWQPGRISH
jgi:hypothetical protein